VEYNRPAQVPTTLKTDGTSCNFSSPGPWVTTRRPTLSGKPRDPDGRTGAHLQIRTTKSSSTYYSWKTATNRKHNTVVNHRIPYDKRLPSGNYRWRMRSLDSHPQGTHSDWRQWCYFRVDVTSPTTPKVEIVGEKPSAGEPVTLRFTSSDKHSGLSGFWYGINEEVKRTSKSSSGTTTITFTTPSSGGRNWIYVWSRDKAGNYSNRAVFDFFSARFVEATPVAAWRLDGDGVDDSGQGHELQLGNGVAWEDDGGPPADRSLGFDGTGCVATEGPVVRTDAEYTVAAWVRVDEATTNHMILGQAGRAKSGFYFRYRSDGRWGLSLTSADAQGPTTASVVSAQPAVLGQWTHVVALVDPAARHMRLYVDGVPSAEREIPFIPWHAEGATYLGCAANQPGTTWYHHQGAIHHVGVWQGLLTEEQIEAAYAGELPAGVTGDWALRADGVDASPHARDITVPTTGVAWVDDQYGRQHSAMRLNGAEGSWAESTGPIVRTDQSFSVSAWAKLDNKDDFRTIASQGGTFTTTFNLNYQPFADRWQLSMSSHDDEDLSTVAWHIARSTSAPVIGEWYHLVGVYDRAANQLRLYVNGELQEGDTAGPATPWRAPGPLLVGTGGNTSGERSNRMVGTISDVKTYRGALTDDQVTDIHGNPAVEWLSQWSLDADGSDDVGDNALTVVGDELVDYEWVEDRDCFPLSALGLRLSGQAHAHTGGPVVVTDESFTVAAWVKLDSLGSGPQTILSQGGDTRAAFQLQATSDGRWRFVMPHQDDTTAGEVLAESAAGTATVEDWTHLAAVFDLARGEVRLYVDGEPVGTGTDVSSPWHGSGPFYIGVAGNAAGTVSEHTHGAVDYVTAWSSTLDPARIADLALPSSFGGLPCF
jgi:hypothetical protein